MTSKLQLEAATRVRASKMDSFLTIANYQKSLTFVAKLSISGVCGAPDYASGTGTHHTFYR